MLSSLRKSASSWVVRILLFLLVISFGVWGIGDFLTGHVDTSVATVGGEKITAAAFQAEYRRIIANASERLGKTVDTAEARRMGLPNLALAQLMDRVLLDQEAARLNVVVNNRVVADTIRADKNFANASGQFNKALFDRILATQGWSEPYYVHLVRGDLIRKQLIEALTAGVRTAPAVLVNTLFRFEAEQRMVKLLLLPPPPLSSIADPGAKVLDSYYHAHAARYTAPEFRTISFVTLDPAAVADRINVTQADLEKEYQAHKSAYVTPERRTVSQMLFPTKAAAEKAYRELSSGELFDAVAAKELHQKPQELVLGSVTKSQLPKTLQEPVFALAKGGFTKPVKDAFGWHILTVTAIAPGHTERLAAVKNKLRQDIVADRAGNILYDLSNKLQDAFAGGATVEETAKKFGLKAVHVSAIDRSGDAPDGKVVADLPPMKDFLKTVFNAPIGGQPQILDTGDNGYVALSVQGSIPPKLKPLASIRKQVIADWKRDTQAKQAVAEAKKIANAVNSGAKLNDLARLGGGKVDEIGPIARNGKGKGSDQLSPELVGAIFAAKPGIAVTGPGTKPDQTVVAEVTRVITPGPNMAPDQRAKLAKSINAEMENDLVTQYREALGKSFGVSVNQANLQTAL